MKYIVQGTYLCWVESCPSKDHVHLERVNVILFGNRIYTDRRESQAIASRPPEEVLDE